MMSFSVATDRPFPSVDLTDRPLIAFLYMAGDCLMDLFGPMYWAALIVGFVDAEIFLN